MEQEIISNGDGESNNGEYGMKGETAPGLLEPWVRPLLKTEFYTQCGCGSASSKGETNMYCIDCVGSAFCEKCKTVKDKHQHHTVIQVYKSSHSTCFRRHDIKSIMDISSIQSFINNSHHVIYIRSRRSNGPRNGAQPTNRCIVCAWELKPEGDKYCSIACKVHALEQTRKGVRGWKTRNKGTPCRAPHNYGPQHIWAVDGYPHCIQAIVDVNEAPSANASAAVCQYVSAELKPWKEPRY